MKKTILISAILFSFNGWAHYEIFPSCLKDNNQHRNYTEHDVDQENIQYYKSIKKAPAKYPTKALSKEMEGTVILEYTINNKGKTENIIVVESSNYVFEHEAIKAVSKFIYEPSINLDTGLPMHTPGVKHAVSFRLTGYDDILLFSGRGSGNFNREINIIQNLDPEQAIERILFKLPSEKDPLKKAVYYYLKYLRSAEIEPRNLLVEKEDIQTSHSLLKDEISLDPNVIKVKTYIIPSLAFVETDTKKAIELLEEVIHMFTEYNFPPSLRAYYAYSTFGVLAYNSGNWCGAYKSFDKAIDITKNIGLEAPPKIEQYRDFAKQKSQ